ncbi:hypothetical protein Q7C36_005161 [Tachysurus vachellii]|uniref:Uncharacterized protein n=1 Tax=Tachysurus vachellii TaxID=175792 RepID=A0AA88NPY6_TACVA|nr:hypothetical protein Q7C36_005161 [Tachysurus vachellii]
MKKKLSCVLKEQKEPEYYKVRPKNATDEESCLATRFTVHNDTEETWPLSGVHKAGAVLFDGEGYYSRLMLNDVNNCIETNAKTNFLALTIFWLRILFFKTIAFNILMTVKVWLN